VFAEQANKWSTSLTNLRALLDVWIDVQRRWVYLEGVFMSSADIRYQLPDQYHLFGAIDKEWVPLMRKVGANPLVLEVAATPHLQRNLERLGDLLGKVQKALGEYLERQRATFPRFYFVGDEDMLEILGNGSDPMATQRHLSKMFAGITSVLLGDGEKLARPSAGEEGGEAVAEVASTHVSAMVSREGEEVPFVAPVDLSRFPKVNEWLTQTEVQMQATLAALLAEAVGLLPPSFLMSAHASFDTTHQPDAKAGKAGAGLGPKFLSWVTQFPAQTVLLAMGVMWSAAVDAVLQDGEAAAPSAGGDSAPTGLEAPFQSLRAVLNLLADEVLRPLQPQLRKKYEQLITELVYNRDVTRELADSQVSTPDSFQWLYRVRYYWDQTETELLKQLAIRVARASFHYGFEYGGVGERLVQTPLTDRCYLTLTQALHFRMGGSPFGPAGTGKTESVKALGARMGRFVLVFNCDENFDFQAMGRLFVGLCQVGAWGCFDEFNRLEERILSAVSQQILAIQTGLQASSVTAELLGKSVKVGRAVWLGLWS